MKKNERNFAFSINTNTMKEALCCARPQRPHVDVVAATANGIRMAGLREPIGANYARTNDAHRLLGHIELDATRATTACSPEKQIQLVESARRAR